LAKGFPPLYCSALLLENVHTTERLSKLLWRSGELAFAVCVSRETQVFAANTSSPLRGFESGSTAKAKTGRRRVTARSRTGA
jgi:hypothetical protein